MTEGTVLVRAHKAAYERGDMLFSWNRTRSRGVLGALLLALTALLITPSTAVAYPGAPWFEPSKVYTQNFPDPDVMMVGDTYYAYSTATGGAYLPVSTSKDLVNWVARKAYDPGAPLNSDPYFNDALPYPASWGGDFGSGRMTKQMWAPGVVKLGSHYVAYYTIRMNTTNERWCITYATSSSPEGPFKDTTTGPLVCDSDPKGSIDPDPFVDPATGIPYLVWKSEGVVGSQPTKLWSRQLNAEGTGFATGSVQAQLLQTSQSWEGNLIESPSMVRYNGILYLFYSANNWDSAEYATSYGICETPLGPCHKPRTTPLLASSGDRLGPGGVSAFNDANGGLRIAYHYWNAPYTSYPTYPECEKDKTCTTQGQRRMALSELRIGLEGLEFGSTRPSPALVSPDLACPAGTVPEDGYWDVPEGSSHENAIDCLTWWGITQGNNGGYNPSGGVTRAQMASFLARTLRESGGSVPVSPKDYYTDDNGSTHEASINALAALGLVRGTSSTTYSPSAGVTREQMASLLLRSVEYRTGKRFPEGTDWFYDDDSSAHEVNINTLASLGVVGGSGGGAYSPGNVVRRDQMASFLTRTLEVLIRNGAPPKS